MGCVGDLLLTGPMGHFKGSLHFLAFLLALQGLILTKSLKQRGGGGACFLARVLVIETIVLLFKMIFVAS